MNANPNKSGVPDAIIFFNSVTTLYIKNSPSCLSNSVWMGVYPSCWNISHMCPFIENKIEKSEKSNYHPILSFHHVCPKYVGK